jgi:hypothetical protein
MTEREEKVIDLWVGARLGLRSGAFGGTVAGLILGLLAAILVLFTDFQFGGVVLLNIFWLAAIYGFVLGLLGGALGGLIAGAIAGATRVPENLTRAGALAGAAAGLVLMFLFFLVYAWLNTGQTPLGIFLDLAPVGLVAALDGAVAGAVAGRRFAHYYDLRPSRADYGYQWEE